MMVCIRVSFRVFRGVGVNKKYMQLAIIREVTDFDFLCSFDELTLNTADKSTLKSVVIYFRDKRIHFVSILLGQVCALGKGTRNEDALQNIFLQVSQKT